MSDNPDIYDTEGPTGDNPGTGLLGYMMGTKGPSGFGSSSTADDVVANWDGAGKVVIVTGANSGLGKECARALASRGAHVILACRSISKAEEAAKDITALHPTAKLEVKELDLASLTSVRQFSQSFLASKLPLHVLLLNAGMVNSEFALSEDGHELQFATNYLGHFLLVQLLLDKMIETTKQCGAPSRIISLSSLMHFFPYSEAEHGPIRFDMLDSAQGYDKNKSYGQSKLCSILFARELQRRIPREQIIVAAVHPGAITTELNSKDPVIRTFLVPFSPVMKSIPQGSATSCYVATAPDIKGGEYYADCNIQPSSTHSHNAVIGRKLWEVSEMMVAGK
eukprot:CAMPEP_0184694026 /NCGR_PEP_ID=MMETSP0313-20130426/2095_1 /TAXON_ID=2792 /ORGANISM="Porphyridium aerugineum, Strain SAG 1380-2" /LENGTH=337 /DNA_ID=CAMNT_0027152237 /DNA_START=648 /DNA_END=1661 /DNA_ORIENTATION=+